MPPKGPQGATFASFLPAALQKTPEPEAPALFNGPPRPPRCRCEGPFDLCWRYPKDIANPACKPTWDRILAPFAFRGRPWTIVELRSLWPHTIQALNERLQRGRMERTLKEDLQDDLQVWVDLIQHSCKPHPRPPRAGMKTLIVQGRILAEAIAQDALFQLDPADPSAPRPDRDLVDLIARLREHHPASLLAPALHVLRTLGNTAVHLDRDSARLTDAEIGDAACICCRCVVLVVDAYMHMCANLHRHEEAQEALAQPLAEAPVAPIPAPNVLLRPREAAPAAAAADEGAPANGGGSGGRRYSSGGGSGGARSHTGSLDGTGPRVPYSLAAADGGGVVAGRPGSPTGSRQWWPPMAAAEAAAVAAVPLPSSSAPTAPPTLLRRPDSFGIMADGAAAPSGPSAVPLEAPVGAASISDWLQSIPTATPAAVPNTVGLPYQRSPGGSGSGMAPYVLPPAAGARHGAAAAAASSSYTGLGLGTDSWLGGGGGGGAAFRGAGSGGGGGASGHPAGSSPTRRSPISLVSDPHAHPPPPHPYAPALHPAGSGHPSATGVASASHPNLLIPVPIPVPTPSPSSTPAPSSTSTSAAPALDASKRLLQLCAASASPPGSKVQQLLEAGASLAVQDKSGMSALHMACYWCHVEAAGKLLAALARAGPGFAPHMDPVTGVLADREGRTPLWVAAQRGHVELVRMLAAAAAAGQPAGGGVNVPNTSGVTPLRVAAAQGHAGVVEALLAAGADVEAADKDGFTPLYVACARSHVEAARLLLTGGALPDRPDRSQRTPLWAALHPGGAAKAGACPDRRAAVVRALLGAGADVHLLPDARDRDYCWQVLAQSIAAGE
ncbi:hypothetical protein HYH03_000179 [Edaphochlamys debaryana]|uniref:Uncharacterized protein n=1 Tax=Edaphochlamys debaryana TaxID=47281 RepID=A0A835YFN1_9CHLO|nr:hypothetical protein HYH03_000179 [Edaphochlamys debaryana]|eukprot:KAG2501676.1 hypothetical protein HYH03_000179 [Edaphochlamys debaryana]